MPEYLKTKGIGDSVNIYNGPGSYNPEGFMKKIEEK